MTAMDVAIPIVYPDYLIAVNTPGRTVEVPDLIPWFDVLPGKLRIPPTKNKVSDLGHAAILFINGMSGVTKYFEYGRYDRASKGITRRVSVPNVNVRGGSIDLDSLKRVLHRISAKAGQHGRIQGAYIEVAHGYPLMLAYARKRLGESSNPKREEYSLVSNSCVHFMKQTLEAAKIETPSIIDPRPTSYILELQDEFRDLDYDPKKSVLKIEKETLR